MLKIPFHPDKQSYTATPPEGAVREVRLMGGKSYQRRGLLNGTWRTTVQFTCDRNRYDLLCGFHDLWADDPKFFTIDLILNEHVIREYPATFVADSFKLASQSGLTYVVTATLEVKMRPVGGNQQSELNKARAVLIGIYGSEQEGKRVAMDPLYEIVNIVMPIWEDRHVN